MSPLQSSGSAGGATAGNQLPKPDPGYLLWCLDAAQVGTWHLDVQTDVLRWNHVQEALFGLAPGTFGGKLSDFIQFVLPEDLLELYDKGRHQPGASIDRVYDFRIRRADGAIRWLQARSRGYYDDKGVLQHVAGVNIDVTDRREAALLLERTVEERTKALRSSLQILEHAEQAAGIGNWQWNLATGEHTWSNNLFRLFGYEPGEIVPTLEAFQALVHPDDRARVFAANAAGALGEATARLFRVVTRQGLTRWVKGSGTYLELEGQPFIFGTTQDVTELVRSNEDLQQFAHVASHDLKEPIRKIQVFISRLRAFDDHLPDEGRNWNRKVDAAAGRLSRMVEDILRYSSLGGEAAPMAVVDLNELVAGVRNDLEMMLEEKNGTVESELLPVVTGAPVLLYQLFYNLVSNALKFAQPDVPPVVRISAAGSGNTVEIRVSDNGIGFPSQQSERIFRTFTRLHSRDQYEGTGLGLALCKKIVERHRGTIRAEGHEGRGATFFITLPSGQNAG